MQTLIESGANIHDYFCTTAYLDEGVYMFMPVLYYAVWLPFDNSCTLHRDRPQILWDNHKLQNMIKTLLSLGADLEQNCLVAPGYWNDKLNPNTMNKKESEENAITLARNIIADQKDAPKKLSQESLAFLDSIMKLKQELDLNTQQEETEESTPFNVSSLFNFCKIS